MFAKTVLLTRSSKQPVSDRNIAQRKKRMFKLNEKFL